MFRVASDGHGTINDCCSRGAEFTPISGLLIQVHADLKSAHLKGMVVSSTDA
jgi:hypothetical protein